MTAEQSITFLNRKGKKLFGVVHVPKARQPGEPRIGISLANPGIKYRVAPGRLNVNLARELCSRGYFVLRFDPEGIGDSEGDLPSDLPVADVWGMIQTGLFVDDTLDANTCFIREHGIAHLFLVGNCGGAITSLLTSALDARVGALCLIDVPVYLWDSRRSFADVAVDGGDRARWLFSEYLKRTLRPGSWYRLLTFKTNYRALWKTIEKRVKPGQDVARPAGDLEEMCREHNLNRRFFEAFDRCVEQGKSLLFLLAENDHGTGLFNTWFRDGYLRQRYRGGALAGRVEIAQVDQANHVYTLVEWQEDLFGKIVNWVERQTDLMRRGEP